MSLGEVKVLAYKFSNTIIISLTMVFVKPIFALGLVAGLIAPALSAAVRINALGDSITGSPVRFSYLLLSAF